MPADSKFEVGVTFAFPLHTRRDPARPVSNTRSLPFAPNPAPAKPSASSLPFAFSVQDFLKGGWESRLQPPDLPPPRDGAGSQARDSRGATEQEAAAGAPEGKSKDGAERGGSASPRRPLRAPSRGCPEGSRRHLPLPRGKRSCPRGPSPAAAPKCITDSSRPTWGVGKPRVASPESGS